MPVTNDIVKSLDSEQHSVALLVYLSKAFCRSQLSITKTSLYRPQCNGFESVLEKLLDAVTVESYTSASFTVTTGFPQNSISASILFSVFINEIEHTNIHSYADDTIIYTVVPSLNLSVELLQEAFQLLEL